MIVKCVAQLDALTRAIVIQVREPHGRERARGRRAVAAREERRH